MSSARVIYSAMALFAIAIATVRANPLVTFPDGPAAWTVNVTASPNAGASTTIAPTEVIKVAVSQSDKIRRNEVDFKSGVSRVTWSVPGTSLLLTEDPKGTPFLTPVTRFFFVPYLPSIFDWISSSNQQEKDPVFYGGKQCFHYKSSSGEAWIESKTLLPVAFDDGVRVATFTFQPVPESPVVLPAKFKQILDNYAAVMGMPKAQPAN